MPEDRYKTETGKIIGAAITVHRTLGFGLREKTYERALVVEFQHQKIPWQQQPSFDVVYRDQKIDTFTPDLIAYGMIIIDAKTVTDLGPRERAQMINYLRITKLKLGLLINFARPKIDIARVVL